MAGGLAIEPLTGRGGFNWIFLIEVLVCGILALFFLFYFNRLFATIVGYCIRAWTWHKYRAYIDISALQISLLGGRIFFKSITYRAHNVTCLIYEGHITWRYWLRLVQEAEVFEDEDGGSAGKERSQSSSKSRNGDRSSSGDKEKSRSRSIGKEEQAGTKPKKELPCRISVKVTGVEAFVYNRSPAYDMVLEQTLRKAQKRSSSSGSEDKARQPPDSSSGNSNEEKNGVFGYSAENVQTHETDASPNDANSEKLAIPAFLRIFPVHIECKRAAAALGNENTTSVISAKLEKAAGTIDAGHAGPLDLYRLLFNFDMEKINVTLKPNRDFKQLQLDAAKRILRERESRPESEKRFDPKWLQKLRKHWHSFVTMLSTSRTRNGSMRTASLKSEVRGSMKNLRDQLPTDSQWHGLARYLDDEELDEHDEWRNVEYAKASTLADIEKLNMNFYFDMPGKVPNNATDKDTLLSSMYDEDINGSKPPAYGMDFAVHGGIVTYGPWTDRQRLNIQQIFFPQSYVDAVPPAPLRPGETRNWTLFKIFITIEKDVTLRVPTREASKDERWQGRAEKSNPAQAQDQDDIRRKGKHGKRYKAPRRRKGKQGNPGADARPYGWIDVTVKTDSTVSYIMDMFSRSTGYRNKLDLDVKGTEITSSVNHGLLWRTGTVSLDADLSQPAAWNTLRKWPFNITIDDLELFILRDHLFLIIDIVNDWSAGPPSDFYTFVPYIYSLRMLFRNFCMYLNVNDANIVNEPADFDKNDFLTLEGLLDSTLDISMEQYRPVRNFITFDVLAQEMKMRMLSPTKTTMNAFLKDKVVADLPKLTLKGSYSGHIEERPGLTDTLRFDIVGSGLTLKAYGFLVRQLINIKENYFGDYMHFKTLEEFQGADEDLAVANIKTASLPKPKSINELDVILCIIAEDATVLAPTNLYSCDSFVRAELPVANLDLRIVSYYLDMGLQLSPITFLTGNASSDEDSPVDSASSTQLFVKHCDLDGHRSFGLPPNEPAYISQWNIDVGAITGEISSAFIHDLSMAGRAFVFGFSDRENALPLPSPSVFFDATFVRVQTDILRLWLHVGEDALLFSADPIEVVTNDWAGDTFSQRVCVLVPKVTVACVDARSASRHRIPPEQHRESKRTRVRTYAFFQTGAAVNVVIRKLHFEEEKQKQQAHIRENDARTHRAPFLLRNKDGTAATYDAHIDFQPPAMPYPSLPPPFDGSGNPSRRPASIKSIPSYTSNNRLRQKPSSSSMSTSIRSGRFGGPTSTLRVDREVLSHSPASGRSARSSSPASSAESRKREPGFLPSDRERKRSGLPPSSVAFSSPFSEPYFPLDMVVPDESNVPDFEPVSQGDDIRSETSSISQTIDDPDIDHDVAQTSVLIRLTPGIRLYVEPRIALTGSKLLGKILPKHPEEVMDTFQMDVLGAIAAKQSAEHGSPQTLEIQIGLPAARLRAAMRAEKGESSDQADVTLRSVETLVRARKQPSHSGMNEVLAVHATVSSMSTSFGLGQHGDLITSAVNVTVDDLLVWVAQAATTSIHAAVGDTVLSVSGEQAEYLTDFVLRLLPLVDKLQDKVLAPLQLHRKRLLMLIWTLTQNSEDVGDPPFLSRLTYILRAFPDHFRNQESWKVLVRFRYILQSLPQKVLDDLISESKKGELKCPADAPAKALDNWAQWRNWDVPNIHQTTAFQMLFHDEHQKAMMAPEQKPLTLTVRSVYLRLAVEFGDMANEIIIEETSLGLDSTPPTAPTGLMLLEENTKTKNLLQLHTTSIAISANWTVFDIVEIVLPLTEKLQSLVPPKSKTTTDSGPLRFEDPFYRHVLQLVASTDVASTSLQSINVRHASRLEGLKLSLIGTTRASFDGDDYGPCASAIINADAAMSEIHGPTRTLWEALMTSPSIYVDHLRPTEHSERPASVTVAFAYRSLRIALKEQIPGVIQIVDSVILDEVAKVMKLVESTKKVEPTKAGEDDTKEPEATASAAPKVNVALLAGELEIEVSLLQELMYQLSGTAASIRVAPSMSQDKAWSVDFDVGQQSHCFVNSSKNERHEQSILDVPPINGHVGIELSPETTSLDIGTTIERIDIDATVIQDVLTIMNKPEVQHVISAIKDNIEDVKHHVEQVKPPSPAVEDMPPPADNQIAFDVRFALLGVRVAATTPQGPRYANAEVEFGIGPVHAIASNRATFDETKSLVPEVRAQIRDIGARLSIYDMGKTIPCGNVTLGLNAHFKSKIDETGKLARKLTVQSHGIDVNAYPDTASTAVDVINQLQDKIKNLDLSKEAEYLRRLRDTRRHSVIQKISGKQVSSEDGDVAFSAVDLLSLTTNVQLDNIKVAWLVDESYAVGGNAHLADLVLTLDRIEFTTRGGQEARLTLEDLQLQLARKDAGLKKRPLNSAILPEVSFSVAYSTIEKNRSFAFKAAGQPLEVRLESKFIYPVNALQKSINTAIEKFKTGTATWESTPTTSGAPRANLFDTKRLASLLVEADFAGAEIYVQGSGPREHTLSTLAATSQQHGAQHGRYGQFAAEGMTMHTTLTAPGIAMKVEYNAGTSESQASVHGEVRVDASSNTLLPNVVPLLLEVSNGVKEVIANQDKTAAAKPQSTTETKAAQRFFEDESIVAADPSAIFGKTKVDLGLRVCRQEFGLTCQPIARVDANAQLEDFYITMNTIDSEEHGHFFALTAVVTKLGAQVKHMYSREPTFSYEMDSIVLSVLNSKHLSGTPGISAILKINPTRTFINGKQFQDLLLFREIWVPPEIRSSMPASQPAKGGPEEFSMEKYHLVAAAAAFPWNATVSIAELAVDLDLGQSIGKPSFTITNLWASQTKSSNWEQNLCVGMDEMAMSSTGRMSGFVRLTKLGVRTSIKWPQDGIVKHKKTPLIQASLGFERLLAKAAFDYQAFAFGDIEGFDFLMYNVHQSRAGAKDRLVAVLDCEKAYVFCTSTSPAQAVGLYQAFDRLIQEKQAAYMQSLRDIEKHIRRESTIVPTRFGPAIPDSPVLERDTDKLAISLHTDVVLTIGTISFGVFPSTFFDSQIVKVEANTIQARFAVGIEKGRIHSGLGMTLGQLQAALASVRRVTAVPKALDISVDEVVNSAVNARGGTILRVPKVVASMQTWQAPDSNNVDYIFKSLLDGKIDVGWNLSRVDFIKNMWTAHSRALASRLGKALPESAVKITAGPATNSSGAGKDGEKTGPQEKITAEVNLPQSRYEYHPLEPPIIETPQLRDMGEATPPLEWIGLQRDKLPNVTHQIIIVSLLEVAKEVEDAYEKILGSS